MKDITSTITKPLAVLGENGKGYTKEANFISWNGNAAKLDIREWHPNHERCGKGITLTEDEGRNLYAALKAIKFLQIEQFTLEQTEKVFHDGIVQTVPFSAHALSDAFFLKHPLILLVLILPALVRMKNQTCIIRNLFKRLVQHRRHHAQHRPV